MCVHLCVVQEGIVDPIITIEGTEGLTVTQCELRGEEYREAEKARRYVLACTSSSHLACCRLFRVVLSLL